jgi:hypothetical protein
MKRCAECQFIYEDSDQRCDMDGSVLVHDPRWFEDSSTSASPPARRGRILLLFVVNLVLVTVLAADYYSFSHRNGLWGVTASAKAKVDSTPLMTPVISESATAPGSSIPDSSPAELVTPAQLAAPAASAPIYEAARDNGKAERKSSENRSSKRVSTPRATTKETRPAPKAERTQKPEDSKVRSMLKKAGHFLKKPFKL